MKCWQRTIREKAEAEPPEPDEAEKRELAKDFSNATVRAISLERPKMLGVTISDPSNGI